MNLVVLLISTTYNHVSVFDDLNVRKCNLSRRLARTKLLRSAPLSCICARWSKRWDMEMASSGSRNFYEREYAIVQF